MFTSHISVSRGSLPENVAKTLKKKFFLFMLTVEQQWDTADVNELTALSLSLVYIVSL